MAAVSRPAHRVRIGHPNNVELGTAAGRTMSECSKRFFGAVSDGKLLNGLRFAQRRRSAVRKQTTDRGKQMPFPASSVVQMRLDSSF
jgi:hypothetical protein